jgi:pimeloyl-ACP methyl ester carboxylesterase
MSDHCERKSVNSRRSFIVGVNDALVIPAAPTETPFVGRLRRESLLVSGSPLTPRSTEHHIPRDGYKLFAQEYEGSGPTLVLLHGFPDNRHICDRLIPSHVVAGRRVVAFDFLGFGDSDKPAIYKYSLEQQTADIRAVRPQLWIGKESNAHFNHLGARCLV